MWQFRMWGNSEKLLSDGRRVLLLDPGKLNTDSGPDFFNAKIIIDGIEWVGNVEVHVKAPDWKRHGQMKTMTNSSSSTEFRDLSRSIPTISVTRFRWI